MNINVNSSGETGGANSLSLTSLDSLRKARVTLTFKEKLIMTQVLAAEVGVATPRML